MKQLIIIILLSIIMLLAIVVPLLHRANSHDKIKNEWALYQGKIDSLEEWTRGRNSSYRVRVVYIQNGNEEKITIPELIYANQWQQVNKVHGKNTFSFPIVGDPVDIYVNPKNNSMVSLEPVAMNKHINYEIEKTFFLFIFLIFPILAIVFWPEKNKQPK